ncbi:MAG: hypothetical protein HYT42_01475 [Candidatus Sungbacteria bacterium]|nr:hypothetical protein [Candidatus Sungbacteria bacterium]
MGKSPVSADGMVVVASIGRLKPGQLPEATDTFAIVERGPLTRSYECGHHGSQWFIIDTYGERTRRIQRTDLCPECTLTLLKKHIIRCALCALSIVPGDGVALYSAESEGLRLDIATLVNEGNVIGCLRLGCCPSGGFFAGNWSEDGFIPRFGGRSAAGQESAGKPS